MPSQYRGEFNYPVWTFYKGNKELFRATLDEIWETNDEAKIMSQDQSYADGVIKAIVVDGIDHVIFLMTGLTARQYRIREKAREVEKAIKKRPIEIRNRLESVGD